MPLQSIINWILPRDDKFFNILEQHTAVLAEAAAAMTQLPLGNGAGQKGLDELHALEHRGDDFVRAINLALDETFVTPIDREDIHSLSTQIDDVLDMLYAASMAFVTYDVHEKTPAMQGMIECLAEATAVLRDTVPMLRLRKLQEIAPARLRIIEIEKRGDTFYRGEMAALYKNPAIDAKELLRQQAVLDSLEAAIDHCQDAADVLENIAVKHA